MQKKIQNVNIFILFDILFKIIKNNKDIKLSIIKIISIGVIITFLTGLTISSLYPLITILLTDEINLFSSFLSRINLLQYYQNNQIYIITIIFSFIILKFFLTIYFEYLVTSFTENLRIMWSNKLLSNNLNSLLRYSENKSQGKRINNFTREPFNASRCIYALINLIFLTLQFLIVLLTTILINIKLTIGILLFLIIVFIILSLTLIERFKAFGTQRVKCWQDITGQSVIAIKTIKDIKIFNLFNFVINNFYKRMNDLKQIILKVNVINKSVTAMGELVFISLFLIIIFILNFLNVDTKNLIVNYFGLALIIFSKLFQSSMGIFKNNILISNNFYSLLEINSFLPEEKNSNTILPKILRNNYIKIENLSISNNNVKVFENLNLELNLEEFTFLSGSSGSGKSTLADLITHLKDPDNGNIWLNDQNIKNINLKALREKIQYVTQNNYLLNDTLYNNLILNKKNFDRELFEILINNKDLNISINNPERLNEVISEDSSNISGGEKKRISIFRSILLKPKFIIFDETTSSISQEQERRIFIFLKDVIQKRFNMGFLVITHNNRNKDLADNFINLDDLKTN